LRANNTPKIRGGTSVRGTKITRGRGGARDTRTRKGAKKFNYGADSPEEEEEVVEESEGESEGSSHSFGGERVWGVE
jgi:hypothetical protein